MSVEFNSIDLMECGLKFKLHAASDQWGSFVDRAVYILSFLLPPRDSAQPKVTSRR
jgi:hypothetical protein